MAARRLHAAVVEAQAVDHRAVLRQAEDARLGIARLGARRHRADLDEAESEIEHRPDNKTQEDAAADYAEGARRLGPYADYLTINVSSPNTPGLRALQGRTELEELLGRVMQALPDPAPPLLLKIAPDLTEEDKADIAAVCLAAGVSGIIATNTTIARPASLKAAARSEAGGLSGRPLFEPATAVLSDLYR